MVDQSKGMLVCNCKAQTVERQLFLIFDPTCVNIPVSSLLVALQGQFDWLVCYLNCDNFWQAILDEVQEKEILSNLFFLHFANTLSCTES
jgi:hypothetical protein